MKTNRLTVALAVQGALAAMAATPWSAHAQEEPSVAELTHPSNYVEIGAGHNSQESPKFGEYNGLDKRNDAIVDFSVRGGDAYGAGTGTRRWSVTGTDLGLTSRNLGAEVGDQGKWNLGVDYDQLRHNITNTYQTPFLGSPGSNSFNLPQSFGVINTVTTNAGGVLTSASKGTQTLTAGQQASFQTPYVYSQRENSSFTAGFALSREWNVQFDYNRLKQTGAKLIGSGTDVQNPGPGGLNFTPEAVAILMNPTQSHTDTYNLAANWLGERGHMTVSAFGSVYRDDYSSLSWTSPFVRGGGAPATGTVPAGGYALNSMSTPPDNNFYQLNLNGGYAFDPRTRLAGGLSYGRNTQDQGFGGTYTPGSVTGLPVGSLDGLVVTEHADLKLTHQTTAKLALSAGLKYDKRDNRTSSNTFNWLTLGADPVTSIAVPQSNKRTQFELAGDYHIDRRQNLHLGYTYEKIDRWCNNNPSFAQVLAASPGPGGAAAGSAAALQYYAMGGVDCAQVPRSTDNTLGAAYRLRANDAVTFNAGYSYAHRKADLNSSFYNPMQGFSEGYELPGYVPFFEGTRTEQTVKGGVAWQAVQRLNVGLNGRYLKDEYKDSSLGVQKGHRWSSTLDAAYTLAENSTLSAYYTVQDRTIDLTNSAWNHQTATYFATRLPWNNSLDDADETFGLGYKQGGLAHGKLDLSANLTYSL
ncbi:MAG TPA: MtrB/PioB family decaheme-associated outer membrane protein, partial [Rhodocyclaceae bacterium]